ncbi:hypothetical protein P7C70_g8481, partial [Phenoliferia sp. Uapishka_3]
MSLFRIPTTSLHTLRAPPTLIRGLHLTVGSSTTSPSPTYARPDGLTSYVTAHLKDKNFILSPNSLSQIFTLHSPKDTASLACQLRHSEVQKHFKEINVIASEQCSYNLMNNGGWGWDNASENWEEAKALAEEAGITLKFEYSTYTAEDGSHLEKH